MTTASFFEKQSLWPLIVLGTVPLSATASRADGGPRANNQMQFRVTYAGQPLADADFQAAVLRYYPHGREPEPRLLPGGRAAHVSGADRQPYDPEGGRWNYAYYREGGQGADGEVQVGGFWSLDGSWRAVPERIRLAIYLPSQQKTFVTDEAETPPLLRSYRVDLHPDGTGTLRLERTGLPAADALLGLARMGIGFALALTLLSEGVAVAAYAYFRRQSLRRLLLICLVVNVLTVPVLWVVTIFGFFFSASFAIGMLIFIAAEVLVTLFEGTAYAKIGRLGWAHGLGLALLANVLSAGLGLLGGGVWDWYRPGAP